MIKKFIEKLKEIKNKRNKKKEDISKYSNDEIELLKFFKKLFIFAAILGLLCMTLLVIGVKNNNLPIKEISYSELKTYIVQNKTKIVELHTESTKAIIEICDKDGTLIRCYARIPSIESFSEFMDKYQEKNSEIKYEVILDEYDNIWYELASVIFSIGIRVWIIVLVFGLLKAAYVLFIKKEYFSDEVIKEKNDENLLESNILTGITFKDVAGIDEELEEIKELVEILKNPEKYVKMGIKVPKGALLIGEPGTGKTLIAKAIAGEAKVPFFSSCGSSFDETYVGVGASRIRKLFAEARKNAPCVVFIDEIDSIASNRYGKYTYGGGREQTLNQLLAEIDGFNESEGILLIGATNHSEVLDSAITRPGRFDRIIEIPLPDKRARYEILSVHARNKVFEENQKEAILLELAEKSANMSGAQLENILNESAIIAIRNGRSYITSEDTSEGFIKVILGVSKKDKPVDDITKKVIATHEAGHALVSRLQMPKIKILEISIVPRGNAGGYTLFSDDEKILPSAEELEKEVMVCLGGRAAEEIIFGTITSGASQDLEEASELIHEMIYSYAMGESTNLVKLRGYDEYNGELEEILFPEVFDTMDALYEKTKTIIDDNQELLKEITSRLMNQSTLNSEEAEKLFSEYSV